MTTANKNFKKNYFTEGEHDKGGDMAKGITVFIITVLGRAEALSSTLSNK